jgi:hypothetical protein
MLLSRFKICEKAYPVFEAMMRSLQEPPFSRESTDERALPYSAKIDV